MSLNELIISGITHEIAYNRRVREPQVCILTFEMPEAVKDLLAWYEEQPLFEPGRGESETCHKKEGISRTYQITTLYTGQEIGVLYRVFR